MTQLHYERLLKISVKIGCYNSVTVLQAIKISVKIQRTAVLQIV